MPTEPLDYSHKNLRGRSFKGHNLEGVNFSGADIRSADFTNAKLKGANFSNVKAGLQKRWAIFLVLISYLISGLAGFLSAFAGAFIGIIFDSSYILNQVLGWMVLMLVIFILIAIIRLGLNSTVAFAFAFFFSLAYAFAIAFGGEGTGAVGGIIAGTVAGVVAVVFAFAFTGAFTAGGAGARAGAFAFTGAGVAAGAGVVAFPFPFAFALAFAVAFALLGIYISRGSLAGDKKYVLIRNMAIAFAAFKGTSFRSADLTDANFKRATLKSTDFREAILTRTSFHETKKLDLVRPGSSYLQITEVRSVLVTGQGQEKKLDRLDLRGVNFKGATLVDTSFIGANLSEANLQDADLSRAKLVQAQLDGTDFTGATLTGAYIEDWNITSDTKFDGVRCECVYMRLPTKENPNPLRKPDNEQEVFGDGEFGDFIKPIVDTLDLYHNQGVDPRAIAISLKQLAENNPNAELEIVAMEKRGSDKFLLRAKTVLTADKSELSAEYFKIYNYLKGLNPEEQIRHFLTELKIKDNQINLQKNQIINYENMINTALGRPSIQAENYNNQGDTMSQRPKQQFKNDLRNAQIAGGLVNAGTVSAGQIGGNINNYTPQQRQNLAEAAAQIQQLLQQLEQTNPTTTTSEKMTVVAKAIDEIEKNPTLKARVIGALKSGGKEALKEAVDHPLVNILMASIEGWQEAE